jgi:hypothetical protein
MIYKDDLPYGPGKGFNPKRPGTGKKIENNTRFPGKFQPVSEKGPPV